LCKEDKHVSRWRLWWRWRAWESWRWWWIAELSQYVEGHLLIHGVVLGQKDTNSPFLVFLERWGQASVNHQLAQMCGKHEKKE